MSELSTDQKIDALYQKFVLGVETPVPGPSPLPSGKADWWNPTAAEEAAFNSEFTAVVGTQKKIAPLADPFNVEQAKRYAKFGFRPDGTAYVWTKEWQVSQRQLADKLHACGSAAEAERLITGAGAEGVTEDAVIFSIMTGLVELKPFIAPTYGVFFDGRQCQTIEDLLAFWNAQVVPGAGGPGPGGPGPGIVTGVA